MAVMCPVSKCCSSGSRVINGCPCSPSSLFYPGTGTPSNLSLTITGTPPSYLVSPPPVLHYAPATDSLIWQATAPPGATIWDAVNGGWVGTARFYFASNTPTCFYHFMCATSGTNKVWALYIEVPDPQAGGSSIYGVAGYPPYNPTTHPQPSYVCSPFKATYTAGTADNWSGTATVQ